MQAQCARESRASAVTALGLGLGVLREAAAAQGIQGWLGFSQGWNCTGDKTWTCFLLPHSPPHHTSFKQLVQGGLKNLVVINKKENGMVLAQREN